MTFEQCESQLTKQLTTLYDSGEATAIASRMLEEYTGYNRPQRRINARNAVDEVALKQIEAAAQQLLQGKPLQYVLGWADFYGLRFQVNGSVLIPRPETEELVDWIIKDHQGNDGLQIIDIGTGSGCIPVALKAHFSKAVITAVDVSTAALEVAAHNAAINKMTIRFSLLDFTDENNWQQLSSYNIIVSNPPYIPQQESISMDKNVTAWEPAMALFVPNENPLLFYETIAAFGKKHLQPDGAVYLEVHKDYATRVQQLFSQRGYRTELRRDMHGNDRMVKAVNSV